MHMSVNTVPGFDARVALRLCWPDSWHTSQASPDTHVCHHKRYVLRYGDSENDCSEEVGDSCQLEFVVVTGVVKFRGGVERLHNLHDVVDSFKASTIQPRLPHLVAARWSRSGDSHHEQETPLQVSGT